MEDLSPSLSILVRAWTVFRAQVLFNMTFILFGGGGGREAQAMCCIYLSPEVILSPSREVMSYALPIICRSLHYANHFAVLKYG